MLNFPSPPAPAAIIKEIDNSTHTTEYIDNSTHTTEYIDKPTAVVTNKENIIAINSAAPVVVLSTEIELKQPSQLMISGVINGTWYYVSGIAAYVNNLPIGIGNAANNCHADVFQVLYGVGHNHKVFGWPYKVITEVLEAGTHKVEVAVISRWNGSSRTCYVNNRAIGDMCSPSTLEVRTL